MSVTSLSFNSHPALDTITPLLRGANLPTSDLTAPQLQHFFTCGDANTPVGLIGVELYGQEALLRSLVVSPAERTQGTGTALVAHIEQYARAHGARSIYLLTTTAERFFERLGYQRIERAVAPTTIASTAEFSSLCPASSAFMIKRL